MQEFERICNFPQSYGHLVEEVSKALNILNPKIKSLVAKRIAEDLYLDFREKTLYWQGDQRLITELRGNFVIFDITQSQINLSNTYKVFQMARVFRNYFRLLMALSQRSKQGSDTAKFHLFFGLPQSLLGSDEGLDRIFKFLERHHLVDSPNEEVLALSTQKYVGRGDDLSVHTSSNLAIYIFRHSLNNQEKYRVFFRYTIRLFAFLVSVSLNPSKIVLASEHIDQTLFAYPEYVKRIATLNVTQTMLLYSPIVFELSILGHIPRNMWWYSANNIPFEFKDGSKTFFDPSIYIQPSINKNYVWSSEQIDFVSNVTGHKCEALGSILFYLMDPPSIQFDDHNFVITIFDVIPYIKADKRDFYTSSLCENFLLDVVAAARDLEIELGADIRIQVKSKRQRSFKHDPQYFDLLDSLSNSSSVIQLSEDSNLYNLIYESDLVVSVPFTSPALVAMELGTPSCYFLESDEFHFPNFWDGVPVFTSKISFREYFREVLKQHV